MLPVQQALLKTTFPGRSSFMTWTKNVSNATVVAIVYESWLLGGSGLCRWLTAAGCIGAGGGNLVLIVCWGVIRGGVSAICLRQLG